MQRQEIQDKLDRFHSALGAAQLDGKDTSRITKQIVETENELRASESAEAERVRREREQVDRDRAAERRRLLKRVDKLEGDRLLAWADLQVACGTMRDALARVVQNSEVEKVIWGEMREQVPPALNPHDVYMRLGLRIANELSKAPGCKARIGGAIQWQGIGGLLANDTDWRAAELRLMEIPIKVLMDELNIEDAQQ